MRTLVSFARATALALGVLATAACREPPHRVEFVPAPPTGEVEPLVRKELARARGEGRRLLVYVGASWCEPCQRFHKAAEVGQLDDAFPTLRLLDFDRDRDEDRLAAAGYTSRLIPLLAVPGPDGRASGRMMEGSIKGEGAVDEMAPRLRALLGK